jgi:hypothetical protein
MRAVNARSRRLCVIVERFREQLPVMSKKRNPPVCG